MSIIFTIAGLPTVTAGEEVLRLTWKDSVSSTIESSTMSIMINLGPVSPGWNVILRVFGTKSSFAANKGPVDTMKNRLKSKNRKVLLSKDEWILNTVIKTDHYKQIINYVLQIVVVSYWKK